MLIVQSDVSVIFPYMHIMCFGQTHTFYYSFLFSLSPFKQFQLFSIFHFHT
jgi:hypothetical protein